MENRPPQDSPRRRIDGRKPNGSAGSSIPPWFWLLVLAFFAFVYFTYTFLRNPPEVRYSPWFLQQVEADNIASLNFQGLEAHGELRQPREYEPPGTTAKLLVKKFVTYIPTPEAINQVIKDLNSSHTPSGKKRLPVAISGSLPTAYNGLVWLGSMALTTLALFAFALFMMRRARDQFDGGILGNFVKNPARRHDKTKQRTTFDEVAGLENAKSELQEIVEFLKNPDKFKRLGGRIPKGVLLVGPPGSGKTLLARAVAGEAGVPFFSISGSEFIQMFVGVGAGRVRDMFKTARESSPCILFIDEIDAVGRVRGAGLGGGHDEREQTLNQILTEMDGFSPNESVIVLAATNRPDVLDPALLRPGRFDRHVTVDRPTRKGRLEILKVHSRNVPMTDDVDLDYIARGTVGMSGADLANLINEAALLATREDKQAVDMRDLDAARDKIIMGAKREEVIAEKDKRMTAYHEIGHALVAWLIPEADPVHKVTIIPRGRSLGVTQFLPTEDDPVGFSQCEAQARLAVFMGGRAAERLIYGDQNAGVAMDLKQATRIARMMVTQWGMSDRLGPIFIRESEEHPFLGREMGEPRDHSEHTAQVIDEEVARILREADERAFSLLKDRRADLERLTEALIEREVLSVSEIEEMIGKRAGGPPDLESDGHPSPDGMPIAINKRR